MRAEVRLAWPGPLGRVGSLLSQSGTTTFEYDRAYQEEGRALNPLRPSPEPLATIPRGRHGNLRGFLGDAVPDGWGLRVLQARALARGIDPASLDPAALLCLVGRNGPGALTFHPEADPGSGPTTVDLAALQQEADNLYEGTATMVAESARQAMGASGGARPKVLLDVLPDGTAIAGTPDPVAGATSYLIKFPTRDEGRDRGRVELAYAAMARAAGITMPPTRAFPLQKGKLVCFGVERFDRPLGRPRPHVLSLAAALEADYRTDLIDYRDFLQVTQRVTGEQPAVLEAYRRMLFNVLAGNRDDHLKNFAFLLPHDGEWELAPAFDLVPLDVPRHTTTVADQEANITRAQCRAALAETLTLTPGLTARVADIEDGVLAALARWRKFADEAEVPAQTVARWTRLQKTIRRSFEA